jgi:hypothetical protein
MPLDRSWFEALVDDSGSGEDGSLINNSLFSGLLDAFDAELATMTTRPAAGVDVVTITHTGQNFYTLPAAGADVVRWNGAGDVVWQGWNNGTFMRQVLFQNVTSAHAAIFAQTLGTSSVRQYIGPGGSAQLWHDGTAWHFELIDPGAPIAYSPQTNPSNTGFDQGNATLTACFVQRVHEVYVSMTLTVGSTTNVGTLGPNFFDLPPNLPVDSRLTVAWVKALNSGVAHHVGLVWAQPLFDECRIDMPTQVPPGYVDWSPVYPFAWGVDDTFSLVFTYFTD